MVAKPLDEFTNPERDIAIIGMACLFPQACDVHTYWKNIWHLVDAIQDPPSGSLIQGAFGNPSLDNDRIYMTRGGYLGGLPDFFAARYGVPPSSVDGSEPEHFMCLQLAWEALRDAGYPEKSFHREKFGVFLGRGTYNTCFL